MYHNFGLRDAFEQSAFGLRFIFARAAGKRGKTTTASVGNNFGMLAHYKGAEVLIIIPNLWLHVPPYLTMKLSLLKKLKAAASHLISGGHKNAYPPREDSSPPLYLAGC